MIFQTQPAIHPAKILFGVLGLIAAVSVISSCAPYGSKQRANEIGDPSVSSPELDERYLNVRDAFTRHDTNFDGFLDQHEFAQFQSDANIVEMRSKIPELASSGPMLFEEIDENDDGRLSFTEVEVIAQPLMPKKR
jgi:Ca2+-binding EF-hand superfamily protein